jgi:hypothetical protein
MEELLTRAGQLAKIRKALQEKFPRATFSTNDDANPSTPMSVRAEWGNGRIIKTVRANSPRSTADEFLSKAISLLEPFQADNVPSRHQ